MGNRTSLISTVSGATSYTYDAADRLFDGGRDELRLGRQRPHDRQGQRDLHLRSARSADAGRQTARRRSSSPTTATASGCARRSTARRQPTCRTCRRRCRSCSTETTGGQTSRYVYGHDLLDADRSGRQPGLLPCRWAGQHAGVEQRRRAADGCVQLRCLRGHAESHGGQAGSRSRSRGSRGMRSWGWSSCGRGTMIREWGGSSNVQTHSLVRIY